MAITIDTVASTAEAVDILSALIGYTGGRVRVAKQLKAVAEDSGSLGDLIRAMDGLTRSVRTMRSTVLVPDAEPSDGPN